MTKQLAWKVVRNRAYRRVIVQVEVKGWLGACPGHPGAFKVMAVKLATRRGDVWSLRTATRIQYSFRAWAWDRKHGIWCWASRYHAEKHLKSLLNGDRQRDKIKVLDRRSRR